MPIPCKVTPDTQDRWTTNNNCSWGNLNPLPTKKNGWAPPNKQISQVNFKAINSQRMKNGWTATNNQHIWVTFNLINYGERTGQDPPLVLGPMTMMITMECENVEKRIKLIYKAWHYLGNCLKELWKMPFFSKPESLKWMTGIIEIPILCLAQLILQEPQEFWPFHTSLDRKAAHSFNQLHVINNSWINNFYDKNTTFPSILKTLIFNNHNEE